MKSKVFLHNNNNLTYRSIQFQERIYFYRNNKKYGIGLISFNIIYVCTAYMKIKSTYNFASMEANKEILCVCVYIYID